MGRGAEVRALAARAPGRRGEPHDSPPVEPRSRQAGLLELQRGAGNRAVSALLRQPEGGVMDWLKDRVGDLTDSRENEACLDAKEDLEDFMSRDYSVEDHHPTTGRGLFDATYRPADGVLEIRVGIAFKFVNGDPTDATWIASVGGAPAAAAFPAAAFTWTPDEIEDWKANAIASVQAHWSSRYTFYTQRACWETLPPVNVSILIEEAPEGGADKAHFVTTVNKWPTEPGLTESVTPPGATDDQSTARFHESGGDGIENLDRSHFTETTASRRRYGDADRDNPRIILFGLESADISADDKRRLATFGATLGARDMPPFEITVTGRASSDGKEPYNLSLSERRAQAVSEEIVKAGAKRKPTTTGVGEAGAAPTPDWRRVDITVGSFQADQTTVLHEFGHMFGLGDEYPAADQSLAERLRRRLEALVTGRPDTSRTVGAPVAHSALAERLIPGQQPILAHDSDNIMSAGETIRPHHYVTFLEVLGVMTDTEGEWDVRPGPGHSPQGPGDFPTPAPGGPVTV